MGLEEEVKKHQKPKGNSSYTGRKGATLDRLIGSDSPYKTHVSRHFRRNLNQLIKRGPSQEEVQAAKAQYDLKTEVGRAGWAYRRHILGINAAPPPLLGLAIA